MAAQQKLPSAPTFAPALATWPDAGVYQLWITVRRAVRVRVGALGELRFARGTYVYTGRAARGLRARVERHASGAERQHWHVDYLLAHRDVRVTKVVLASRNAADECRVNCAAGGTWVAVPRFGASDCQSGCPGHLWRVKRPGREARSH